MQELSHEERMRLMRFVCSFAWADLRVSDEERRVVGQMILRLHLDGNERKLVESWLEVPPTAEELDPNQIPRDHRDLFLDAARAMVAADGVVNDAERDSLTLLEQLL